jgi:hypothetical protein
MTANGVRGRAGGAVATKSRGPGPSGLLILITTYHTYLHAPLENSEILIVLLVSDDVSIINSSSSIIINSILSSSEPASLLFSYFPKTLSVPSPRSIGTPLQFMVSKLEKKKKTKKNNKKM